MTLAYDDVVNTLLETCEATEGFSAVQRALLVRTVTGQVRLVLDGPTLSKELLTAVESRLAPALGGWFQGPVISPQHGPQGLRQVAAVLLHGLDGRSPRDTWPPGWPTEVGPPGLRVRTTDRWFAHQVTLGKEPWMAGDAQRATPPWPMRDGTPRITAFYGFKGGVGRSTTAATLAYHLAHAGRSVVCVDLDLEAPGLTSLLVRGELPTDRGYVIDDLLSAAATGSGLDDLPVVPVEVHGATWELAPAGVLGPTYIEKLARLDTLHRDAGPSPVHAALRGLLKRIKARPSGPPDHIFLDCRSGLHDLAGLALHDLAHVDVIVGRGDRQELDGLRVLLPSLLRRRRSEDMRLLVVRTFVQRANLNRRMEEFRSDLHDLLAEHVYEGEPPSPTDRGVAHDPCPVQYIQDIADAQRLEDVGPTMLAHEHYADVLRRLDVLWMPEAGE